jgi:hypothetical protein
VRSCCAPTRTNHAHSLIPRRYVGDRETLGQIGFIQIYPELCGAIERLVNRKATVKVEEVSDDLPREMAERNEVVRKTDK